MTTKEREAYKAALRKEQKRQEVFWRVQRQYRRREFFRKLLFQILLLTIFLIVMLAAITVRLAAKP